MNPLKSDIPYKTSPGDLIHHLAKKLQVNSEASESRAKMVCKQGKEVHLPVHI